MGGRREWDGTISFEDFRPAAAALAERWKSVDPALPRWSWVGCPTPASRVEGYLSLTGACCFREHLREENGRDMEEMEDDVATVVQNETLDAHFYDYHILYSFSYRVPVLYFRGSQCDGQPLQIKQIEDDLPLYSSRFIKESKWTYITLEEHPFLHRPWCMLHPCGTGEWMRLLLDGMEAGHLDIQQYLPSWLSVVGQAVGLRIPLEMKSTWTCINS